MANLPVNRNTIDTTTMTCAFWDNFGRCRNGANCLYAHYRAPGMPVAELPRRHPTTGTYIAGANLWRYQNAQHGQQQQQQQVPAQTNNPTTSFSANAPTFIPASLLPSGSSIVAPSPGSSPDFTSASSATNSCTADTSPTAVSPSSISPTNNEDKKDIHEDGQQSDSDDGGVVLPNHETGANTVSILDPSSPNPRRWGSDTELIARLRAAEEDLQTAVGQIWARAGQQQRRPRALDTPEWLLDNWLADQQRRTSYAPPSTPSTNARTRLLGPRNATSFPSPSSTVEPSLGYHPTHSASFLSFLRDDNNEIGLSRHQAPRLTSPLRATPITSRSSTAHQGLGVRHDPPRPLARWPARDPNVRISEPRTRSRYADEQWWTGTRSNANEPQSALDSRDTSIIISPSDSCGLDSKSQCSNDTCDTLETAIYRWANKSL